MREQDKRKAARPIENPRRPLGEELIERSRAEELAAEGIDRGASPETREGKTVTAAAVTERAQVIMVLRKAEEFASTQNPPASTPQGMRRAIELAAGRVGVTIEDYDHMVARDAELQELQRRLFAAHVH